MNIAQTFKRVEKLVGDNSPLILTAVGVAGVVGTAVLTGQAVLKADRVLRYVRENGEGGAEVYDQMPLKTKAKLVWTYYIPPALSCSITVGAIIFANRIGTRRAAALAAAYAVSEKAYEQYREKVVETIGELKEKKIQTAVAQQQVKDNPPPTTLVVAQDKQLCSESYTGRYFMSSYEDIRRAENDLRERVYTYDYASLGDLYDSLGLKRTSECEEVGWNADMQPKIDIAAVVAEDGRPCLVMSYRVAPIRGYSRFH